MGLLPYQMPFKISAVDAMRSDGELHVVERRVVTAASQKLRMRAGLDDPALAQHDNAVRALDRRETMRDDERSSAAHEPRQRGLDAALGFCVERRRRLVED